MIMCATFDTTGHPLLTKSLWWYCEVISPAPVVHISSAACHLCRHSVCL